MVSSVPLRSTFYHYKSLLKSYLTYIAIRPQTRRIRNGEVVTCMIQTDAKNLQTIWLIEFPGRLGLRRSFLRLLKQRGGSQLCSSRTGTSILNCIRYFNSCLSSHFNELKFHNSRKSKRNAVYSNSDGYRNPSRMIIIQFENNLCLHMRVNQSTS